MTEIITALITGGLALIGTAIGTYSGIKTSQRVNEVKIEELTREVREHNGFAKRLPVVENDIKSLKTRVSDLEALHKRRTD